MLKWSPIYLTGYPVIDEQHEKIFNITNEVSRLLNQDDDISSDQLNDVIEDLIGYTIYHFSTEEEFWEENSKAILDVQITDHKWFVEEVSHLDFSSMEITKSEFTKEMFKKLIHWLSNHVVQEIKDIQKMRDV